MEKSSFNPGLLATCFLLAALSLFLPADAHAQTATTSPYGERIFYYSDSKSTVADFAAHASKIDVIAPQTYVIGYNLAASGTVPTDLMSAARQSHVKVMPLIANQDFSQSLINQFLNSPAAEQSAITFMANEAAQQGYIGWQFDLEHVPSGDEAALTSFVQNAATVLHARGLILSIAVVARDPGHSSDIAATDFYKNWSGAYDYAGLAKSADFLSLMSYDDPDSDGPSAPISYVTDTLQNALAAGVPAAKISLGIPTYYWGWSTVPAKRVNSSGTYAAAEQRLAAYPSLSGFNAADGVPWIIYKLTRKVYIIWYEDAQSFQIKAGLVKQYGLRGFSAWVLGSEDPAIWNAL